MRTIAVAVLLTLPGLPAFAGDGFEPLTEEPPPEPEKWPGPKIPPLIGAGVAAGVAGGCSIAGRNQRQAWLEATDETVQDQHLRKWTTYTLIGVGAGFTSAGLVVVSLSYRSPDKQRSPLR